MFIHTKLDDQISPLGQCSAQTCTHWQVLEGVGCHRGVCSEQVLVELVGGPLHDDCVHTVLHSQHCTHSLAKLALKSLKERLPQALHHKANHRQPIPSVHS